MDEKDMALQAQVGDEIQDVGRSTNAYIWHKHRIIFGLATVACIAVTIALCYLLYLLYEMNPAQFDFRLAILPIFPLIGLSALYNYYRSRVDHLFVEQMARVFGYSYAATAPIENVIAFMLSAGHSRKIYDVISGTYKNYAVRIFTLKYTIGYGKNSHTYTKAVFELAYSDSLPHIILKPKSWTEIDLTSENGFTSVELEGDFGKYFNLWVANDAQVEVREIFQPDLMQELIQNFSKYSCEIISNQIYLMRDGPIYQRSEFVALHDLSDAFTDKVIPGLRSAAEDTTTTTPATLSVERASS